MSVDARPKGPTGPASEIRPATTRGLVWAVTTVVVIESLYVLWTAWRGYFFQDDFVDFAVDRQLGFGRKLLEQPVFGHFIPGYNVVNYLVASNLPYRWPIIEAADVLLFALSLVLLYRLLTTIFGPTWLSVPLVALAGASFSLVPSLVWWASGLQQLVAIPATLLAIDCQVRYVTTGRIRYALLGGACLTVGLAFYDGVVVSALFIVVMTVLIWPIGRGLRGAAKTVIAAWPAWLCFGIPVALDLGWRFSHSALYTTPPLASPVQTLQFVWLSWSQTFIPLVYGIDAWVLPTHLERVVLDTAGLMVSLVAIAATLYRRWEAGRAWILFGSTFLALAFVVGLTRVSQFGPGAAGDVRYVTLDAYFLSIALGLALLRVRNRPFLDHGLENSGEHEYSHAAHVTVRTRWTRSAKILGTLMVCLVMVGYGSELYVDQQRNTVMQMNHTTRQFFATFAMSWGRVAASTRHPYLWDTEVSSTVVDPIFYPDDVASVTVGALHPQLRFNSFGGTGFIIRTDGSVVPATPVTQASGVLPSGSTQACVTAANSAAGITLLLDHALGAQRWFAIITYQGSTGLTATESGVHLCDSPPEREPF